MPNPVPVNLIPSPFEHLQDVYMNVYNRRVRKAFREDIDPNNIGTPEGALLNACLIRDDDTANVMLLRIALFNFERGEYGTPVYGIPTTEFHEAVTLKPQLKFIFRETSESQKLRKAASPKRVQPTVRIMNQTVEQVSQSDISTWENRIRSAFPKNFRLHTGTGIYTYFDPNNGYRLQIPAFDASEARTVITKILSVQNHTFDSELLNESKRVAKNFAKERFQTVLGKRKKLPQHRPVTKCYLEKVELFLHGNHKDLIIYNYRD